MKVFFRISVKCYIRFNSRLTEQDADEICLNTDGEEVFVEILPTDGNYYPTTFLLNEKFLSSPPDNISVTKTAFSYIIDVSPERKNSNFYKVFYKRLLSTAVGRIFLQIYRDGNTKINVMTKSDSITVIVPDGLIDAEANICFGGNYIYAALQYEQKLLFIFETAMEISVIFRKQIDSFSFSDKLTTETKIHDTVRHSVKTVWKAENNRIIAIDNEISCLSEYDTLPDEEIIPYLFLEEFSLKGNFSKYLSHEIGENSARLGDYLGEYVDFYFPPDVGSERTVCLAYRAQSKNNVFFVKYLAFSMENGLISNITFISPQ